VYGEIGSEVMKHVFVSRARRSAM